jgi:hypothetical protein
METTLTVDQVFDAVDGLDTTDPNVGQQAADAILAADDDSDDSDD